MNKPEGCTHPDCFSCLLDDCEYDIEEQILESLEATNYLIAEIRNNNTGSLRQNRLYKKMMNRKNYLERKLKGEAKREG